MKTEQFTYTKPQFAYRFLSYTASEVILIIILYKSPAMYLHMVYSNAHVNCCLLVFVSFRIRSSFIGSFSLLLQVDTLLVSVIRRWL